MIKLTEIISRADYYYKGLYFNSLEITENSCSVFIKNYFKEGGKLFLIDKYLSYPSNFRATHSTIAYFLSLYIVKEFKKPLEIFVPEIKIDDVQYILYITFLYHDHYSYIEKNSSSVSTDYNLNENLLSIEGSKYLNERYSLSNISRYFKYREFKDHGIIAGLVLLKKLKENLDNILAQGCHSRIINNLLWSRDHEFFYDKIASIVIKHNIWLANSDSQSIDQIERVKKYRKNHLDCFIIDKSERIKFSDDSLLFIFFIIDTIEPIKMYNRSKTSSALNNYSDLLDKIFISVSSKYIRIKYIDAYKDLCGTTFIEAKAMETWMNVEVSKRCTSKHSTLIIKFL